MSSTIRSTTPPILLQVTPSTAVRWRSWPLVDRPKVSWLAPLALLLVGAAVLALGGGWLVAILSVLATGIIIWQYLLPVTFEVTSLGLRRYALGRIRLVPWQAIRAYQLRPTGAVFFQRPEPTRVDVLNCLFVPYPADEDELVGALRHYLPHAIELPIEN